MRGERAARRAVLALSLPLCLWGCASGATAPPEGSPPGDRRPDSIVLPEIGDLPAMSRPIMMWLRAVKLGDAALLSRVFSSRVKALPEFKERGWGETLAHYERLWREKFGEWDVADFYFEGTVRSGDDRDRGVVLVTFKPPGGEPRATRVRVVREGKNWYVDQK